VPLPTPARRLRAAGLMLATVGVVLPSLLSAPAAAAIAAGAVPAAVPAAPVRSAAALTPARAPAPTDTRLAGVDIDRSTIPQLERLMRAHALTSVALTRFYLGRIARVDPLLHAVLQTNPAALAEAAASDARRRTARPRPLEGIPVLLKDNVGTRDREHTTAGSLALLGARPARDAGLVRRLRAAGAIVLGKTNLSEWANFRSTQSSSGWSGVGGQTNSPYALDANPCGSSSGSGAAVAASLAQVAIGTETDGSIVCPSGQNGLVGVKPTLGLVSRAGVVPLSAQQDTPGPMARNVTDAAITLSALAGRDARDAATADSAGHVLGHYEGGLRRSLRGARIGVWREGVTGVSPEADRVFTRAVARLRALGATVVEGADLPLSAEIYTAETTALNVEFKHDINAYLAALPGRHPRTLAGLIAFNRAHRSREMPFFGQETFLAAQATSGDLTDPAYVAARRLATDGARAQIDDVLTRLRLDAVVSITNSPAWTTDLVNGDHYLTGSSSPAAVSGYPSVTVPAGNSHGLPVGISFTGGRWQEERLLQLAAGFERGAHARIAPTYRPRTGDGVHAAPRAVTGPAAARHAL